MMEKIKILLELAKIRITLFVMITTFFGYISFSGALSWHMLYPLIGILFLACGSAAINHIQERNTDALMSRTKKRPIPSGKISLKNAILFTGLLLILGAVILFLSSGLIPLLLGLLNLIWYNIIYTPLKKKSPLAIIPGSLVGAIPPMVGWTAAGGALLDPQNLILAFFFFIWQIPHFWLLLLVLDKDYEKAGFPVLTKLFSHEQLSRITFIWMFATVVTSFMFPLFHLIKYDIVVYAVLLSGVWLTYNASHLLKKNAESRYFSFAFKDINIFALLIVVLLSLDKLIIF